MTFRGKWSESEWRSNILRNMCYIKVKQTEEGLFERLVGTVRQCTILMGAGLEEMSECHLTTHILLLFNIVYIHSYVTYSLLLCIAISVKNK